MRKIKRFLGLGLVLALAFSMLPAVSAKAAAYKIGVLNKNQERDDYYVTVSNLFPTEGTTMVIDKPVDYNSNWTYEYEMFLTDVTENGDFSEVVDLELGDAESVTYTLDRDIDYIDGFWVAYENGEVAEESVVFWWFYESETESSFWSSYPDQSPDRVIEPVVVNDASDSTSTPSDTGVALAEGPEGTVYRLGNPTNGDHLYTTSKDEAKALLASGWNQETTPGISAGPDGVEIFRLTNNTSGEHLFTADKREKNSLAKNGWTVDNGGKAVFYGSKDGTPVYRLFNPNAVSALDSHHFTLDQNEIKVLTQKHGWVMDNNGEAVFYLNK